jgi:chromosome segregation ATPase
MLENNKFVMIDNSCQTKDQTANERSWGLNTAQDHSCTWDQVSTDIESLKSKMSTFQSSVLSFEKVLKDHDTILSLYNRAADLHEKYLGEINEKTRYINSIEQKLTKVEEERDRLYNSRQGLLHKTNSVNKGVIVSLAIAAKATPYHGKKFLIVITFINLN